MGGVSLHSFSLLSLHSHYILPRGDNSSGTSVVRSGSATTCPHCGHFVAVRGNATQPPEGTSSMRASCRTLSKRNRRCCLGKGYGISCRGGLSNRAISTRFSVIVRCLKKPMMNAVNTSELSISSFHHLLPLIVYLPKSPFVLCHFALPGLDSSSHALRFIPHSLPPSLRIE